MKYFKSEAEEKDRINGKQRGDDQSEGQLPCASISVTACSKGITSSPESLARRRHEWNPIPQTLKAYAGNPLYQALRRCDYHYLFLFFLSCASTTARMKSTVSSTEWSAVATLHQR